MDMNSLSNTKWKCKYHIVFAPKFRRKVAYGRLRQDIANILSMLFKRKHIEIIEAEICSDHAHAIQNNWKFVIRVKDVQSNGIASKLDLPKRDVFDTDVSITFTRKNTKLKLSLQ